MIKDFDRGEHLLLMGTQGVGKNRLIDRMLSLLQYPREYIQLHRFFTFSMAPLVSIIHSASEEEINALFPWLISGTQQWAASQWSHAYPRGGCHLKILHWWQQCDWVMLLLLMRQTRHPPMSPAYSRSVLPLIFPTSSNFLNDFSSFQNLIEQREMVLSDGRRIVPPGHRTDDPNCIYIHPNFRMIILANPPGYPFLGNDFYSTLGEWKFAIAFSDWTITAKQNKFGLTVGCTLHCLNFTLPII